MTQLAELNGGECIDRDELLERIDGDMELLRDITEMFLDDCSQMMSDVENAVTGTDAKALHQAAHKLKGAVGNFAAKPAFEAALRLEMMGRNGDLGQAREAWVTLREAIARLKVALAEFRGGA